MKKKIKPEIGILTLFILGGIITFGFICLLQFVSASENLVGFIFTLLAMHVGIVCFILSKKLFKTKKKIRMHYYIEYIMLACYLPFLALAIAKVQIDRTLKLSLIFALTGVVVIISAVNDYFLAKKLYSKEGEYMKNEKFKSIRICDNFYQTSSFFPMPTILVGTLAEDGSTTYGAYSLCFPFYIAGKDYHAMILNCRNSSNTCKNLLRTGKCTLNFVPDDKAILKETVRLGFPGDEAKEKMKDFKLTMIDGEMQKEHPEEKFPKIIDECFQVFECTWMKEIDGAGEDHVQESYKGPYHTCNGITSEFGAHFILRIDKILLKEKYHETILEGVKASGFPPLPVDYGYRDSKNFWIARKKKPYAETVQAKAVDVQSVMYAANRIDPRVQFSKEACETMTKVPRIFLTKALKGCVDWALAHNVSLLLPEHMEKIRNKHSED